jgi:plasmid stability protein
VEIKDQHPRRTRLMIDISPELRRRIKIAAARADLSIKDYVEHILEQAVPAEASPPQQIRRPVTKEAFEELDKAREAIMRNLPPGYVFEDSVETLRQMREERTRQLERL